MFVFECGGDPLAHFHSSMAELDELSTQALADLCRREDLIPRLIYANPVPDYPFREFSVLAGFAFIVLLVLFLWSVARFTLHRLNARQAQRRGDKAFSQYRREAEQLSNTPLARHALAE